MRSVAFLGILIPLAAFAQLPPPPDAKAYPQLNAMRSWLEAGSPQAKQCALSGGLFLEANGVYRQTRSEPRTVDALTRQHASKLSANERERFSTIVTNVTSLAAAFVDLDAESAAVAFSRMCMDRAQKPGVVPAPNTLRAQFDAAFQCQRTYGAGSLDRKECVANAFRVP